MDPSQCSPALNASQGITANADISGIGVRTAIYIQVVISLIHPLIAGYDGKIDDFELESLANVYLGILLPGCALLISAIIQSKTFGLSAYHAMIVLFLSWINNTSALTFIAYIVFERLFLSSPSPSRKNRQAVTKLDSEWEEADEDGKRCILENVEKMLDRLKSDGKSTWVEAGDDDGVLEKVRKMADRLKFDDGIKSMWVEAGDGGVLEKVKKMLDRLKSGRNGTKSASLSRDMCDLEIQQWSLWREKKMMMTTQGDSLEFQRRWDKEWKNNETKLVQIFMRKRESQFLSQISKKSILLTGGLASTHLTLLSGFGWWLWSTLPNFGINQECIPSIRFVFFNKSIPITSAVLRSRSTSIYIFSSLPVFNILIWFNIFLFVTLGIDLLIGVMLVIMWLPFGLITLARRIRAPSKIPSSATTSQPASSDSPPETTSPSDTESSRDLVKFSFVLAITATLILQILLIILTELNIAHNRHLVQSNEGDWTFGQTLALMLTLVPLIEVVKFLWEKRPRLKENEGNTETSESGETAEAQESGETREARESGERSREVGADGLV